jgi:hypothetical protein
MKSFTLDTNCIVDVDENRPNSVFIRKLSDAHLAGTASVSIVAIAASERQKPESPERFMRSYSQFQERLERINLSHLKISYPMAYFGIFFWGKCVLSSKYLSSDEEQIHNILFSSIPFRYPGPTPDDKNSNDEIFKPWLKWRNAKCDVQTIWNHLHHSRDVFVNSDKNFHRSGKKEALLSRGAGSILHPHEAVGLLQV